MKKIFIIILFCSTAFSQTDISQKRIQLILQAFNARPEKILEPLNVEDVQLGTFDGRVVVNKKTKFTYYVQIEEANNPHSKITLIPMSTSRFTPTYYQTDEWWDANKAEIDKAKREGKPAPKQDMNEVAEWLGQMKLSTNPDVITIEPLLNRVERKPLQDFLLAVYLKQFVKDGHVVLYRGAEKPNELDSWKKGETPRGARYWTPTANYAWRYARKNQQFLDLMMNDQAPLFRFEIPVEVFKSMIQRKWQQLTLGTELTKNSHQIFDRSRYFGDHLYNSLPFLGIGDVGVEFEIRANRSAAQEMVKYYKRPATFSDLVEDRLKVLTDSMARLQKQIPEIYEEKYKAAFEARVSTARSEMKLFTALSTYKSPDEIQKVLTELDRTTLEIANIDGLYLSSWAQNKAKSYIHLRCEGFFL